MKKKARAKKALTNVHLDKAIAKLQAKIDKIKLHVTEMETLIIDLQGLTRGTKWAGFESVEFGKPKI